MACLSESIEGWTSGTGGRGVMSGGESWGLILDCRRLRIRAVADGDRMIRFVKFEWKSTHQCS